MESLHCLGLFVAFTLILYKILYQNKGQQYKKLPPSPPSLPLIGHFHLLKRNNLSHALHAISNRFGPTLLVRFGLRRVLLVSTPSAVEECFTKNDVVFANRPSFFISSILEYDGTGMGSSPYGHDWRNLRRIASIELFSSARLQMTSCAREEEIRLLAKYLARGPPKKVEVKSFTYVLNFNINTMMIAGYRHFGEDAFDLSKSKASIEATQALFFPESANVDLVEYFPFLRFLPFVKSGKIKKMYELVRKREDFMRDMIDANEKYSKSSLLLGRTLISKLLSLRESEPDVYTDQLIFGLVSIMLVAGAHSSAIVMGQTVSHLMSHPEVFKKARDEIDANVPHDQLLDDSHLAKLPYLHCIINESMRLGPIGSLIPLHESSEDCQVGGYEVPRGTMLFVNAFPLQRDPSVWADPNEFKPERFQGEALKEGPHFMPFGLGRRKCPGWTLAMKMMPLTLGTLIQCFDWQLCDALEEKGLIKSVDMVFRPRHEMLGALSRL